MSGRQSEIVPRAERAAIAQALRSEGLKYREIAERMGLSMSYVHGVVTDPDGDGDRKRKAGYVKPCLRCGEPAPSTGSDGKDAPSRLCQTCRYAVDHENRHWTRERIINWIKDYVAEHGSVPPATLLAHAGIATFGTEIVRREFGPSGWRKAVREAGFTPLKDYEGRGGPLYRDHPLIQERLRLVEEGVSLAEIARRQGVTSSAVRHTINHYVGRKPMASRLSATAVLEREKERAEMRIKSLREEMEEEERNVVGLTAALEALAAAHSNGAAPK